ncbi:hypothetical protein JF66_11800 [Cryobacterium sp. MLB-32]|nr:hypothetical protein JF66_11800 [Cryobacterium sp. MLB-32]
MNERLDGYVDTNQVARQRAMMFEIVGDYEAASEQCRRGLALATERVRNLEAQVEDDRCSVRALRSEIATMKGSKSWRMTRPLRALVGALRRVLRRT